jgi:putative ABC transport system permease protein
VTHMMSEVRLALRALRKAPAFTLTAIGTLGLAIGASAAIFTLVNAILLTPLPYADPDRLVMLRGSAPGTDIGESFGLSTEFLIEYHENADLLEGVASYNTFTSTLRTDERVDRVSMSSPSLAMFEMLGVQPLIGRLPTVEDADQVALLSHGLWMDWFAGDPNVLGRSYSMAGRTRTVIGIMPPDFDFPREDITLWIPNPIIVAASTGQAQIRPGSFGLPLVARVKPGVDPDALIAQLDLIASRLPEEYGGSPAYAEIIERFTPQVVPLREQLLGSLAGPLWILLGATGILLLIACANVANLFLARAEAKRGDVAIRRAIGAPRWNLIRRQLVETTVLAIFAGALAVGVAAVLLPLIVSQVPAAVPRLSSAGLSLTTILFTFGVSVIAGLLCGIVPAVRTAGVSLTWLRDRARGSTRTRHLTRDVLVVGQAALALVLLFGSGLLLRSFMALKDVDPGYVVEDIFTFQMAPEQAQLNSGPTWASFHLGFMERLRGLPGVETVGIVENFPLDEGAAVIGFSPEPTAAGGAPAEHQLGVTMVAGDYFQAMGIALLRGRVFTEAEQRENPGHIIVSEGTAERLWPGEDPIGKIVTLNQFGLRETVIGVVEDVRQSGFRVEPEPKVYFPLVSQRPELWAMSTPAYVLETPRADSIAADVRALVREVAPEAPMYRFYTIEELVARSMAQLTFTMIALALAAGLALLLGMVGLYGILSSSVAERTRELGVRIALGAQPGRVQKMVVVQGMRVVAVGLVAGVVVVLFGSRALDTLLYGVHSLDAVTLVTTSLLMLLVGAAACWIPAYRASTVDPARTLAEG